MGQEFMGRDGSVPGQDGLQLVSGAEAKAQPDNVLFWEHGRLRLALPMLECRAMAYTAKPRFDDALVEAARKFYGLEMDVASVELEILEDDDQRLRFLPWFIWDWRGGRDPRTVGEQFLAEGGLEAHEIRIVESLCASYVGFYQAHDSATHRGVEVTDLVTGEEILIADDGLVGEVFAGDVIQARLVRVPTLDGECVLLGAIYGIMPSECAPLVGEELQGLGQEPQDVRNSIEKRTSEMLDMVDRVMTSIALPPQLHGVDGQPLVVHRGRLDRRSGKTTLSLVRRSPRFRSVAEGVWVWGLEGRVQGFVIQPSADRVELVAVSERSYAGLEREICEHSDVVAPRMKCLMDLERIVERWAMGREDDIWLKECSEVVEALSVWLTSWTRRWLDRPHIELGDRSPRQAARDPQSRHRVEWLVERLEQVHLTHLPHLDAGDITGLRAQLGLARTLS